MNPTRISFPAIVCLCGSTKFMDYFHLANLQETLAGNIVLSVGVDMNAEKMRLEAIYGKDLREVKAKLDDLHKYKIDMCDQVLVINPGDYIGESTREEIIYAGMWHKKIRFMFPTQFDLTLCTFLDGALHA